MTQKQLGALLEADGLGKHDLGRIERGDLTMQKVHREALVRHLGVPERWLLNENVDEIVGLTAPAVPALSPERLEQLDGLLPQLAEDVQALLRATAETASVSAGDGRSDRQTGDGA